MSGHGTGAGAPRERTLVKICGIREVDTLRAMRGLPVDYVGIMFAPQSRRRVTVAQAAALAAAASEIPMAGGVPPRTVGVFVNPTLDELAEVLAAMPLDAVQLHGAETPAFCREAAVRFGVDVWRALSVDEQDAEETSRRIAAYAGAVSTVLVDTAGGGTGRTFRWDMIPRLATEARRFGLRFFVAGGLSPDNVESLIAGYRPQGVDISSGVETDGVKDNSKIADFAERVYRS